MTFLELAANHDIGSDEAFASNEKKVTRFLIAVVAIIVAAVALFGYAGLITVFGLAAVGMLITIIFFTLG